MYGFHKIYPGNTSKLLNLHSCGQTKEFNKSDNYTVAIDFVYYNTGNKEIADVNNLTCEIFGKEFL